MDIEQQGSFIELIKRVEVGDVVAEERLWNQFFERLLQYVEGRVHRRGVPKGLLDEEAVTASVFESVFKCAKQGKLHSVQNWGELSSLLLAMTNRKFVDHYRRATAQRVFPGIPLISLPIGGVEIADQDPGKCSLIYDEQLSRLLEILPDDLHRQIAVLKLAEYTMAEIAEQVERAIPTVNRKWRNVRRIWADELER